MAVKLRLAFSTRGRSSWTPPLPILSCGPTEPSGLATYRSGPTVHPPPNTVSRSSVGVLVLGEARGFSGTPSLEVWSKLMSWSMNWPKK